MALNLAFEAAGSGPPLVVLHGLFGSSGNWRRVARELSATHRVISVDLRNHGASPWADSMGYLEMADDVRQFIEREGLGRPAVLGHSMGGKVAMALALLYPEVVGRLIVVDVAPVSYADRLSVFAEAMRAVDTLAVASRAEVQRRLEGLVQDVSLVPFLMQNLVARNSHFDWRINLPAIASAIPQLSDFPTALRGLRCRRTVAVIAGGQSDYVRSTGDFQPMFPQVAVDVLAGAGHWVHAEQPRRFVDAAVRALHDCRGTSPAAHPA